MPRRDVCLEETYAYKRYVPAKNACLYRCLQEIPARERCVYLVDISTIGVILVGTITPVTCISQACISRRHIPELCPRPISCPIVSPDTSRPCQQDDLAHPHQ